MQGENQKQQKIVRSIETRTKYRVVREYKHVVVVTRADRKRALPFSMPRERLEEVPARA